MYRISALAVNGGQKPGVSGAPCGSYLYEGFRVEKRVFASHHGRKACDVTGGSLLRASVRTKQQ